ncbi:hypothetical protein FB561_6971 [Kribbella amoyensis]|uniref:Tox-REase-2 domain-containing protein n=1 Tax=Kribbella amoyensis TaxID=996641 RepID=A0A561B2J6_9ACTN|nr:restriction endonuclease fold toxin-2 domain-containing protein [Kribbella amoyensis]TWD73086.1 hypothetical protein FB561_6971 [Kribbella amoyensis]
MPSDLQRVARGLVDCLDEVPQVVLHLQRTADRCRENAALAMAASHGRATVAAQQLDAAARACEAAAHYLSMAPPKAKSWAERLVGEGRRTDRPDESSADRNKATGKLGDVAERDAKGRTRRLTSPIEPDEDGEKRQAPEPPLIKIARKAFEKLRKKQEQDEEERERPEEPLEVEILVNENGELTVQERDEREEKEDQKRRERLTEADYEIQVDLTEAAQALLEAMAQQGEQTWEKATLVITADRVEATFAYPEDEDHRQPIEIPAIVVDLPSRPDEPASGFDPIEVASMDFDEYRHSLAELNRTRPADGLGAEMDFQRKYCGPVEFRLTVDQMLPRAVWADGLDNLLRNAQDAKYVAPGSQRSFYRPATLPTFLQKIAREKHDHMLLKYREVIDDTTNPVEGLEIITNDPDAAAYFRERMSTLQIRGHVSVKEGDES